MAAGLELTDVAMGTENKFRLPLKGQLVDAMDHRLRFSDERGEAYQDAAEVLPVNDPSVAKSNTGRSFHKCSLKR